MERPACTNQKVFTMPKSSPAKLKYMTAYENSPAMVKRREETNLARQREIRDGKAKVGDGKDVGHIVALDSGGSNTKANTFVEDRGTNRAWRKGTSGYKVGKAK